VAGPGAGTAATAETADGVGAAFVAPGFKLSVHVTTFAVLNEFADVHTLGVTVVPPERVTARPSSAPATIVPPDPVASVVESARSV